MDSRETTPAKTASRPAVAEIVAALKRDAGSIDLDGAEARLFIHTLRRLAEGRPVTGAAVQEIAAGLGLTPDQAGDVLNWLAERDEAGAIVGLAGLSLNDWNHQFRLDTGDYTTWCALDTLYLPPLLRRPAQVSSADPVTGDRIAFTAGPEGVAGAPAGAVISIVIPRTDRKGLESAEQIWMAFCNYSHFFTGERSARAWFAGKPVDPLFLSLDEGVELGRLWFDQIGRHA